MQKRALTGLSMALAASAAALAAPLTPSQALATACGAASGKGMRAPLRNYELSLVVPQPDSNDNALYLFANNDGRGYIIAAADDSTPILLGYSDEAFDADNMPPAMEWWLSLYAKQVQANVLAGAEPEAAEPDERPEIEPMLKSKWNQDMPFSLQTPIFNAVHSPTGCLATALAQVMYYYKYPERGVGQHEYTYVNPSNGKTLGDSFNYDTADPFDWDAMLNVYNANATSRQKNAVALLMHAVGVASDMNYLPGASGASSWAGGYGIIKFLRYNPAMKLACRNWYTDEEWQDIMYDQMAKGQPCYYSGLDVDRFGHAFVLDGYKAGGYYHVNWGWGGLSDGYFLLDALDPYAQGTGGGGGNSGFDYEQCTFLDMVPMVEGQDTNLNPAMEQYGSFTTAKDSYTRGQWTTISIPTGLYNMGLGTINYSVGLRFRPYDGSEDQYFVYSTTDLTMTAGLGSMSIRSQKVPVGTWIVNMAYKTSYSDWMVAFHTPEENDQMLWIVTDDQITTVQLPEVTAIYKGADRELAGGKTCAVTYYMNSKRDIDGEFACALVSSAGTVATAKTMVSLKAGEPKPVTWELEIPADAAAGEYTMVVRAGTQPLRYSNATVTLGEPGGIEGVGADQLPATYYNLNGQRVDNPGRGFYIKRQGTSVQKVAK